VVGKRPVKDFVPLVHVCYGHHEDVIGIAVDFEIGDSRSPGFLGRRDPCGDRGAEKRGDADTPNGAAPAVRRLLDRPAVRG